MTRTARSALALLLLLGAACMTTSQPLIPGEAAARMRALHKQAEAGNGLAQAQLGVLYYDGAPGVARNPERAHHWLSQAASQECHASQLYLGLMHLSGDGVEKDLDAASAYLRAASEEGHTALHQRLMQVHRGELPLRAQVAYEWIRDPLGPPPEL